MSPTFAEIVDRVRELDAESKHELMELMHAWAIEERRDEILRNARLAETELAEGRAKHGGVDELMADLESRESCARQQLSTSDGYAGRGRPQ